MNEEAARESFRRQADWCRKLGSPFTAMVCDTLGDRLDRRSRFGRRILEWPGDPKADALALRAAGALHHLARSGRSPELAAVYPPNPAEAEGWWRAAARAIRLHEATLASFLDSPPQTNEVGRSAVVLGGLLLVAAETGLPIGLAEIGSSAGLNLCPDLYRYELGAARWGAEASSVAIRCEWSGNLPPLDAPLRVVDRAGCDRAPLDPASAADRERLLAYVWPDQIERLERLSAALALAAAKPWRVEKADATDWAEARLAAPPAGQAGALFHTIVWQYLPEETQRRIRIAIERAAARATSEAPLAWLRMEAEGDPDGAAVRLSIWPGGDDRRIARADFHGRWARWL